MAEVRHRNYGEDTVIQFSLVNPDGVDFATGAVGVAGDSMWWLDGTGTIETNNTFEEISTNSGMYKINLDASEMSYTGAASIVFIDLSGTKLWLDKEIVIDNTNNNNGVLSYPQISELTGDVGATPTLQDAVMLMYMALRNEGTSSTGVNTVTGEYTIANDANTVIATGTTVDTGLFRRGKLGS